MQLLPPMRFRYADEDHERYGPDWVLYDEAALARMPARELAAIEATIGMSIVTMMRLARDNMTAGTLAATWVARRLAGVVEDYATYEPLVLLIDWEPVPSADVDPPEETRSTSPSAE